MDKAKDKAINKLIAGQEKVREDISDLKTSQSDFKASQQQMGEDISDLKVNQSEFKASQQQMREDISELKVSQQQFEVLINKVLDALARVERIVINIENDLRPKVHTLFDADAIRQNEINMVKEKCNEHEKRLDNHEMRIIRQEQS